MPGYLQGDPGSLRDLRMVGRMGQQNTGAIAIQPNTPEHRSKVAIMRRVAVRNTNNLQTVHFDLFIAEHPDSGSRDGMQIFTVIPKLLMISGNEIHPLWRDEFAQWLRCSLRIDSRPVVQITSNKNRVRLFLQNLRNHASQETAVSHMAQVQVADQSSSSAAPRMGQVRELHRRPGDPGPACVENPVESGHDRRPEQ